MSNMLVVARKYNDIFYAISTEEWKKSKNHYLIMITYNLMSNNYPMQRLFTKIITIQTGRGNYAQLKSIMQLKKILDKLEFDTVSLSNIALVSSSYIISHKKTKECILLEDGLMNYREDFIPSRRISKVLLERLCGIDYRKVLNKITKTYLLAPELGKYYVGSLSKLNMDMKLYAKEANLDAGIEGKSLFVGQNLYANTGLSVDQYSTIVNQIIKENGIDYYIPHRASLPTEKINCKVFDIDKTNATLEVYAACMNFKLYSFSSSVIFSSRMINPSIETYAISCNRINEGRIHQIIENYATGIIDVTI